MKTIIHHPTLGEIERESFNVYPFVEKKASFVLSCVKRFCVNAKKGPRKKIQFTDLEVVRENLPFMGILFYRDGDGEIWRIDCDERNAAVYKDLKKEDFLSFFRLYYLDVSVTPEDLFFAIATAKKMKGGENVDVIYSCGECEADFIDPYRYLDHLKQTGHRDSFTAMFPNTFGGEDIK